MRQFRRADIKFWVLGIALLFCISVLHAQGLKNYAQRDVPIDGITRDPMVIKAGLRQDIDNFSDDARAMSPRGWGQYPGSDEPAMPTVVFDDQPAPDTSQDSGPPAKLLQQVESSVVRQPPEYFRTSPLQPDVTSSNNSASRLPSEYENLLGKVQQEKEQTEQKLQQLKRELDEVKRLNQESKSVVESKPESLQNQSSQLKHENSTTIDNWPYTTESEQVLNSYESTDDHEISREIAGSDYFRYSECTSCGESITHPKTERRGRLKQRIANILPSFGRLHRRSNPGFDEYDLSEPSSIPVDTCDCGKEECGCNEDGFDTPYFDSKLGHRREWPTQRGSLSSSTSSYSFEDDEEFPPIREILAQSIFFSEVEFLFLQPSFTNNSAFYASDGTNTAATPFNFDLLPAFRVAGGFESDYGPGFAGEYFQFDNDSDQIDFVSNGVTSGQTEINFLGGTGIVANLIADDLGERITTSQSLELHSTAVFAFKAIVFKRAYVKGRFGIQVVSIEHVLESELFDAGGASAGTLTQLANFDGLGPRFGIDYVRRIGHTPAELVASATGAIFFGDQDQIIENTVANEFVSLQADEFITNLDIFFGVQGKRIRGEKRNTTFRVGFVNQSWLGGGTAQNPGGDLGFQGVSFMLGLNR